jgi:thioredoxin-related protein
MRLLPALALPLLIWAGQLSAAPPENYQFLPLTDAWTSATSEKKPLIIYFGRYGCAICRRMHAEVFVDSELHKGYSSNFVLAYVDIESGNRIHLSNGERITEMQFATRSRIFGTPTFFFISPEQKLLFKRAGFQTIEQMTRYHNFISEGIYREISLEEYLLQQ